MRPLSMVDAFLPLGCVVAVGLKSEAALLPKGARILVSGGDPARLAAMLAALPDDVTGVLSFGIAGGLAPTVAPGDLFIATALLTPSESFAADPRWLADLSHRTLATPGILAASDVLLSSVQAKQALHRATQAMAVDMESGVAARFAASRGVPFAALRSVADGPEDILPRAAAVGLNPDGSVAPLRVLAALARHPLELPALIRLARSSAKAHAALRRALA
ncbi:MAG: Phosphorylase [Rubritepida sp.]|nr:Phosphorylase [Rubritepida sp.]